MPNRSWLAEVKFAQDISGEFYNDLGGKPWNDERADRIERKWHELVSRLLPVAEEFVPYFGCRMHDSGVLSIGRSASVLRLRLDSINASDFAHYLAQEFDGALEKTVWPVNLLFHDPQLVRAARPDLRGGLRFADPTRLGETEFLYDWFFQQDGRLQWIAHLWDHAPHVPRGQEVVYLMVDCAKATAEDRCAKVFACTFGEPAADLYRDAVTRIDDRPIDFNVYDDYSKTPDYIRRRMAARGLTRADFQTSSRVRNHDPSARD